MANEDRITGFEYVGATPLTEEQYSTQFVNFYNQFLGLPTLEEETGVEVETGEDITQLRQMTPGGGGADEDRSVLGPGGTIQFQDISIYDGSSRSSFGSYKESLQANGLNDRVPFVENILDPLMSGDLSAIKFGEQAGVIAEQKAAELKETLTTPGVREKIAKAAPKGMAGVAAMTAPGLVGTGFGSVLSGKSFTNAFGKPSYRPDGILGVVTDLVATRQYEDIAKINHNISENLPQTGFAMLVGKTMGITRAPGSGVYTGNMQGMTHKQVKAMEALSKGFTPSSYNMQEETGNSLQDEGYMTGRLATGGYYKENGTYMDAFGNTSYMGLEKDLVALAQKYNISEDQASIALSNARQGNGTLSENLSGFATPVVGMSRPSATAVTRTKYDIEGGRSSLFGPGPSGPGPRSYEGQAFNLFGLEPGIVVGGTDLYTYKAGEYPSTEVARLSAEGVPANRINQAIRAYEKSPTGGGGDDRPSLPSSRESAIGAGYRESVSGGGEFGGTGGGGGGSYGGRSDSTGRGTGGYGGGRAFGGPIGLQAGGMAGQSGFVQRPPSQVSEGQTVADNVNTSLPEGAFVINAAAVEFAGESDIKKMLLDANKEAVRRGLTVDKQGNGAKLIDVAISQGEVVVSPHLAKIIGYDRLEKINNRGKGETQQRIQENGQQQAGKAEGGFIEPPEDLLNYEDRIIADEVKKKMSDLLNEADTFSIKVESPYFTSDADIARDQERAEKIGGVPLGGAWQASPIEGKVKAPQTPTLFNLFALAEELAHASIADNVVIQEQIKLSKEDRLSDTGEYRSVEDSAEYMQFRYDEEMRAKNIAFDTVGGLLPKGKISAEYTADDYADQYLAYLYQNVEGGKLSKDMMAAIIKKDSRVSRAWNRAVKKYPQLKLNDYFK